MTRLSKRCAAPPQAVYDILADLSTHMAWGGTEQRRNFRLISLDAPEGPAIVGTSFRSTGAIPMSLRRWSDVSTITIAERPGVFEFVTHATVHRSRRAMEATYQHRYEITEAPGGSEVSYTITQLEASNPFLRMALPVVRTITWRVGIPFLAGRGLRNLLAAAERYQHQSVPLAASRVGGQRALHRAK
jgi:hypothetical protein